MTMEVRALALCALTMTLGACGGAPDEAAPPPSSAPTAAATPAAPVVAPAPAVTLASLTGDVARGMAAFNQCRACHAPEPNRNGIGPSLAGVVGREAGTVSGYVYSTANKNSHLTWDRETLFTYLAAPMTAIPGTKMTFAMRDAQQRADVIAYLETLR